MLKWVTKGYTTRLAVGSRVLCVACPTKPGDCIVCPTKPVNVSTQMQRQGLREKEKDRIVPCFLCVVDGEMDSFFLFCCESTVVQASRHAARLETRHVPSLFCERAHEWLTAACACLSERSFISFDPVERPRPWCPGSDSLSPHEWHYCWAERGSKTPTRQLPNVYQAQWRFHHSDTLDCMPPQTLSHASTR